mmetsp:Transcript_17676/g.53917  ORF Transcript_17676/g.53917 Transcript_17676/m.53917 type:complete len:226 (-) Transcript_17676:1354-2031(-)
MKYRSLRRSRDDPAAEREVVVVVVVASIISIIDASGVSPPASLATTAQIGEDEAHRRVRACLSRRRLSVTSSKGPAREPSSPHARLQVGGEEGRAERGRRKRHESRRRRRREGDGVGGGGAFEGVLVELGAGDVLAEGGLGGELAARDEAEPLAGLGALPHEGPVGEAEAVELVVVGPDGEHVREGEGGRRCRGRRRRKKRRRLGVVVVDVGGRLGDGKGDGLRR